MFERMVLSYRLGILLSLAILLFLCVIQSDLLGLPDDDRFIGFRYSLNFAEGNGLVYNVGERVEGYTAFLWVWIIGLLMKVGFDPTRYAQFLSLGAAVAIVLIVARTGKRAPDGRNRPLLLALLPVFLLVLCNKFIFWAGAGADIVLYALLVLLASNARIHEIQAPARFPFSSVFLALAALARFDGMSMYVFFLVHSVLLALLIAEKRPKLRSFLALEGKRLAVFAWIYLPYFVWRVTYYGGLVPNTFHAKTQFSSGLKAQLSAGIDYAYAFFVSTGGLFLVVGIASLFSLKFRAPSSVRVVLVVGQAFFAVAVGGDHMAYSRFFIPVVPQLFMLMADGAQAIRLRSSVLKPRVRAVVTVVLAAAVAWPLVDFIFRPFDTPPFLRTTLWQNRGSLVETLRDFRRGRLLASSPESSGARAIGLGLRRLAHPDATLAAHAAGIAPYYSGLHAIDMGGLSDPHIAHSPIRSPETFHPGHIKSDPEFVISTQPTYIFSNLSTFTFSDMTREYSKLYKPCEPAGPLSGCYVRVEDRFIDLGPNDNPAQLKDGWGPPTSTATEGFREVLLCGADLDVYFYRPQQRTITIRARSVAPALAAELVLVINGKCAGLAHLSDGFEEHSVRCHADLFKFGVNRISLWRDPDKPCLVDWLKMEGMTARGSHASQQVGASA